MNVFEYIENWKKTNNPNKTYGSILENKVDVNSFLGVDPIDNIDYKEIYETIKASDINRLQRFQ